jgi:regulatory protein
VRVAQRQRALELAYRYLSRRERTACELRRHLLGREIDEASIAEVIDELAREGSLDDARFARLFVQDKRELEQWGTDRIRRALLARGINGELVEAALATGDGDANGASELDRALGVLRHRFPTPPQGRRERERALGVLLRKGYEPELALDALYTHARGGFAEAGLEAADLRTAD